MDKKIFIFSFLLVLLMISGFAVANSGQLEPSSKFFDFDKNSDGVFGENDIDYWIGGYKYQVLNAKNLLYIVDKIPADGIYSCDESNIEACLKMPLYTNNKDSAQARSLFILNAFETTPALRVFSQTSSNKLSPSKKEFSVTGGVINNVITQADNEESSSLSDSVVEGKLIGITGSFSLPSGNPGYRPPPPKAECGNGQCEDGESAGSCASDCTPTIPPIILDILCQGVICPAYSIPNNPNLVCTSVPTYGGCCTGLSCVNTKPEIEEPTIEDEDLDDNDVPDDFPEIEDEDIIEIACETGIGAEIVSEESIFQVMQGVPTGISGNTITGSAIVGICGDGKCTTASGESSANCPKDCGQVLAGGTGVPSSRGGDYETWCGNGVKDFGEQCDYGGNNGIVCSADLGRFCNYCSNSCVLEYVTNNCGDGVCNYGETHSSCSNDCQNPATTDSDGDGILNEIDTDDDNDGVNDGEDLDDLDGGDSAQTTGDGNTNTDYVLDLDPNKQNEECSDKEVKEPVQCRAISCAMPPVSVTSQYTDAICVRESLQLDADGCPVCGDIICEDGTIIPPDVIIPVCDTLIQCQPAHDECSYPSQAYDDNGCMVGCGPMVCLNGTVVNETLIISYQWELVEIAGASPTANVNPNVGSSYGLGETANIHLEGMFAQSNLQSPTSASSVTGSAVAGITGNAVSNLPGGIGQATVSGQCTNGPRFGTWEGTVYATSGVCVDKNGQRTVMRATCGDSICTVGESSANCYTDCGSYCGDNVCNGGETNALCSNDCSSTPPVTPPPTTCGNNVCDAGEATSALGNSVRLGTCPADCPVPPTNLCGNNFCDAGEGMVCDPNTRSFVSGNCPADASFCAVPSLAICSSFTYSAWSSCVNGQQTRTIVSSVPTCCGGGNPVLTQTCTVTPPTAPVCGDNSCDAGEDATNCASDCSGNICVSGNIVIKLPSTATDGQIVTYTDPNGVTITFIAKVVAKTLVTTTTTTGGGGTTTTTTTGTGGGSGGGGVSCPVAPNCPMPAPGCSYPNPTKDANGCITGCGNQVCTTPPTPSVCGNGVTEAPETCDAGNQNGLTCTVSPGQSYCDYCTTGCLTVRNTAITPAPYTTPTPSVSQPIVRPASYDTTTVIYQTGAYHTIFQYSTANGGTYFLSGHPDISIGTSNNIRFYPPGYCVPVSGVSGINCLQLPSGPPEGFSGNEGSDKYYNDLYKTNAGIIYNPAGNAIRSITGNAIGNPNNLVIESPFGIPSDYYIKEPVEIRARFDKVGAEVSKYPIFSIEYSVFGNNWASRGEIWNNKPANDPSKANLVGNYDSNTGIITVPFPKLNGKGRYTVIVQVTQVDYVKGTYPSTDARIEVNYDPLTLNGGEPRQGQIVNTLPIPVSVQLSSDISTYLHQVKFSLDNGKTNSTMTRKTLNLYEGTITQISQTGTIPLSIYVDVNGGFSSGQKKAFQSTFSYDPTTITGTGGAGGGSVTGSGGGSVTGGGSGFGGGTTTGSGGGGSVNIGQCVASGGKWDSINGVCIIGGGSTGGGGTTVTGTGGGSGGSGGGTVTVGTTPVCTLGNADCGNDLVEPGESCDDGSSNGQVCNPQYGGSCDYCTSSCTLETVTGASCGDGVVQTNVVQQTGGGINEQCDLGSQNGLVGPGTGNCQYCSNSCVCVTNNIGPYCGDLQCNNGESYLSCPSDCSQIPAQCGNNVIESGESCDDGTALNGLVCTPNYGAICNYCDSSCQSGIVPAPSCGDGICQSGNENSLSCILDCPVVGPVCGNGIIESGEQCDTASTNSINGVTSCSLAPAPYGGICYTCSAGCLYNNVQGARCGDNTCDAGYEDATSCANDCGVAGFCGDGTRNNGEACDSGLPNGEPVCTPQYNFASSQTCSYCTSSCSSVPVNGPFCGDGVCSPEYGETYQTCGPNQPISQRDCIQDIIPPSCPTTSRVVITNQTSATLNWAGDAQDNAGGSGVAGILLYRFNTLAQTNLVTTATNPTYFVSDVSFVDNNNPTGLTPGTSYYYRFGVRDNVGNVRICDQLLTLTATTLTVPVVVPFTMSIDSPTAGQVVNTSTINFIVSLSQLGGSVKYSLNNGLSNLSMTGNGQVFTSSNTGMTNGLYTLTAYAQNASGSNLTATRQFSVVIASAIAGVSIDLERGYNYFSVPESSDAVVGSGVSSSGSGSGPDKELDLVDTWNLIGYSGVNDVAQTDLEFKGTSGVYKNLNDASREKRIQKRIVEYSAEGQKFVYSTNTSTEEGKAYWVYARETGKLKAPSVGQPIKLGKPVKVQDLQFQNITSGEIKNFQNATIARWIGLPNKNFNQIVILQDLGSSIPQNLVNNLETWKGYYLWSNTGDIKMIVPNA